MFKCTKCRSLKPTNDFRIHTNGKRYKTCNMCLPSEQNKKIFNKMFPNATAYEIYRFGPRQYGTSVYDPLNN